MSITKADILDADFIDADELSSDGYLVYLTTSVISTTFATKIVVINLPLSTEGILYGVDNRVESGDIVRLTGTSGGSADGYFTVDQVLTDLSFSVIETIASSTSGLVQFMYKSGASKVGFDPSGLTITNAHNVQDAIKDIGSKAITSEDHETLRQLIHFVDHGGPGGGFSTTPFKESLPYGDIFPTSIIWYTDNTKTKKIIEKLVSWSGVLPQTVTWNMYAVDGVTVVQSATDTISYTDVFETTITRVIT